MTTVLIADDQALVRDGLRAILDREPDLEVVAEAGDGAEAVALAREHAPDVVLMDIRMPTVDGLAATRQLLSRPGAPRVIILTTFDRDEWVYDALCAGASGFLLKDVTGPRLTDAVRTVMTGESLLSPVITRRLIERFVAHGVESAPVATPPPALTDRETEVWRLVAAGLSNAEIADRLVISVPTVKTHVNRLLDKLGLRDRTQAVVAAYETGIVRAGRPPASSG